MHLRAVVNLTNAASQAAPNTGPSTGIFGEPSLKILVFGRFSILPKIGSTNTWYCGILEAHQFASLCQVNELNLCQVNELCK